MTDETREPERFTHDWLTLREPVDHRSRADALTERLGAWWAGHAQERGLRRCEIVDLGTGTGSNLRYLAPRLPCPQSWTLFDRDAALLDRVRLPEDPDLDCSTVEGDLATGLAVVQRATIVTASALLDLVSRRWIDALADATSAQGAAVLIALSYDGSIVWGDTDPDDDWVRDAVNEHQRRDKGVLGPALGPAAAAAAEAAFRGRGFRTELARSPWRLGAEERDLSRALLEGWREAAAEQRPDETDRIRAWAERRLRTLEDTDFALEVGHADLLAIPES